MTYSVRQAVTFLTLCLACSAGSTQWLPNSTSLWSPYFQFSPLCNAKREQVRVRLDKSTSFVMMEDLLQGDVLYGVKFRRLNDGLEGVAYCKPYIAKELSFWASYNAKTKNNQGIREGFLGCMYDFDSDGVFDDAEQRPWYPKPDNNKKSDSSQFPYTVLEGSGEALATCPRQVPKDRSLTVSQYVWDSLTQDERNFLGAKGGIDIVPTNEAGVLLQVDRIDDSTAATNSGARLGESVAGANYIDKSIGSGSYSATNQLGAQVVGSLLGGLLDSGPKTQIRTRYAVKTPSGSIVTTVKVFNSKEFAPPVGTCVSFPNIEQIEQSICELSIAAFRSKHLPSVVATQPDAVKAAGGSKESRLLELKALFDRGLIVEKVYHEQQSRILAGQ